MGLFTQTIESLDDLFAGTLRSVYYAEHQIAEALPDLAELATHPELRAALEKHLTETEGQIRRLERVFSLNDQEVEQGNCPAIDGILEAGDSLTDDIDDDNVRDAALIAGAQLVEHYEIAQYGTLIAWAEQRGRDDIAAILAETLTEEKAAAQTLGRFAEGRLDPAIGAASQEDTLA
jgi:ferritin-like metal-binding protein YciE